MRHTYLRFVEVVCRDRKTELIKDQWHEGPVAHVAGNLVSHIDILQPGHIVQWPQSCNRIQAACGGAEEVVQHPIVACVAVHESTRDDRPHLEPRTVGRGDCSSQEDHVLHNSEVLLLCELEQCVEDDSGTEGESDKGDGAHTEMATNEDVSQDQACRLGTVKCI